MRASRGVQCPEPRTQRVGYAATAQVRLGHDDAVGQAQLSHGLGVFVEFGLAEQGVERRDDALEAEVARHERVAQQRLQRGRGVDESAGLDHHPREGRQQAAQAPGMQVEQGVTQRAEQAAAQASGIEQHDVLGGARDEQVIEADVAEFVDDHHRVAQPRVAQRRIEQSGLAAAQETGEHRDRNSCCSRPHRGSVGQPTSVRKQTT